MGCNNSIQSVEQNSSKLKLDKNIKEEVESKIMKSEFGNSMGDKLLIYNNILTTDYYENDSLLSTTNSQIQAMPFKSFFYPQNDTTVIDGAYGLFGGFGFSIKLINKEAIIYHMLAGDDFPVYSLTKEGELKYRIEVPTTKAKLTLSKIPILEEEEIVYGIVEFDSNEYYQSGVILDGEEIEERRKIRMNMKIYFKSKFIDIENF